MSGLYSIDSGTVEITTCSGDTCVGTMICSWGNPEFLHFTTRVTDSAMEKVLYEKGYDILFAVPAPEEPPNVTISFFQGQTDITADLLEDGYLGSGDDKKAITTNDILSLLITCADNQGLKSCNFAEGDTGANLNCLGDLQSNLSNYCPSSTSCYAQNFECKFTSTGEWIYNITAIDNNDQSQTVRNSFPFVVQQKNDF